MSKSPPGVREAAFIRKCFSEYYMENSSDISPPTMIEKREFGFSPFGEEMMIRHVGFSSADELRTFLRERVPRDVYYSSAYYRSPRETMEKKGWLGADLIFDVDADHIRTPCKELHDLWRCETCGYMGRGEQPTQCSNCGGRKITPKLWPCETCLEAAKKETLKLLQFMLDDFGFSPKELAIYFSGHRGYHVQIESDTIRELGSGERKEIVDFLQATGIELKYHGLPERSMRGGFDSAPKLTDVGWKGRIAKGTFEFLLNPKLEEELKTLGLKKSGVSAIMRNREAIIKSWGEAGRWSAIKGIGYTSWKKIGYEALKSQAISVDSVVTTDIHRLIRMGDTLHGKTGFRKRRISMMDLENFNPFSDAVVFNGSPIRVHVFEAPDFSLEDESYGPYKNTVVELPEAVALLLLCKGTARLVEG